MHGATMKIVKWDFKLWHPRCVLITVYKERYQVDKTQSCVLSTWYHSLYTGQLKKKVPSIYRKQITHVQSGSQTDVELLDRTVGLRQQVQHSHHADIPTQNSQSHSKCTPICNKSYSTHRFQHPLHKWHNPWKNQ